MPITLDFVLFIDKPSSANLAGVGYSPPTHRTFWCGEFVFGQREGMTKDQVGSCVKTALADRQHCSEDRRAYVPRLSGGERHPFPNAYAEKERLLSTIQASRSFKISRAAAHADRSGRSAVCWLKKIYFAIPRLFIADTFCIQRK